MALAGRAERAARDGAWQAARHECAARAARAHRHSDRALDGARLEAGRRVREHERAAGHPLAGDREEHLRLASLAQAGDLRVGDDAHDRAAEGCLRPASTARRRRGRSRQREAHAAPQHGERAPGSPGERGVHRDGGRAVGVEQRAAPEHQLPEHREVIVADHRETYRRCPAATRRVTRAGAVGAPASTGHRIAPSNGAVTATLTRAPGTVVRTASAARASPSRTSPARSVTRATHRTSGAKPSGTVTSARSVVGTDREHG